MRVRVIDTLEAPILNPQLYCKGVDYFIALTATSVSAIIDKFYTADQHALLTQKPPCAAHPPSRAPQMGFLSMSFMALPNTKWMKMILSILGRGFILSVRLKVLILEP